MKTSHRHGSNSKQKRGVCQSFLIRNMAFLATATSCIFMQIGHGFENSKSLTKTTKIKIQEMYCALLYRWQLSQDEANVLVHTFVFRMSFRANFLSQSIEITPLQIGRAEKLCFFRGSKRKLLSYHNRQFIKVETNCFFHISLMSTKFHSIHSQFNHQISPRCSRDLKDQNEI